jgi:hypothetical protein
MNYINTTPHSITEVTTNTIFPSDKNNQLRISESLTFVKNCVNGIPLFTRIFGKLENEPPVIENTNYIVSLVVQQKNLHRKDFVSPGELVRDDKGVIIGCKGFIIN